MSDRTPADEFQRFPAMPPPPTKSRIVGTNNSRQRPMSRLDSGNSGRRQVLFWSPLAILLPNAAASNCGDTTIYRTCRINTAFLCLFVCSVPERSVLAVVLPFESPNLASLNRLADLVAPDMDASTRRSWRAPVRSCHDTPRLPIAPHLFWRQAAAPNAHFGNGPLAAIRATGVSNSRRRGIHAHRYAFARQMSSTRAHAPRQSRGAHAVWAMKPAYW